MADLAVEHADYAVDGEGVLVEEDEEDGFGVPECRGWVGMPALKEDQPGPGADGVGAVRRRVWFGWRFMGV